MVKNIEEYLKNKDYLVCVDSDGCAMDTMDVKHIKCFGPCMVQEWNLYNWEKDILTRWNDINLYTLTRGINRFKGLAKALTEIDQKYVKIEGLADIVDFAENSKELSNDALKKAIENNPQSTSLKKALAWSVAVNKAINELDESEKLPYKRVNAPTMLADIPMVRTYINAYDSNASTLSALVDNLTNGKDAFKGKDPIDSFCGLWDAKI